MMRLKSFACSQSCSFFFSSRRRHTISDRDWSSDVCSSDLVLVGSNRANQFEGNDGNDVLKGKGGADGLIGGRGADALLAGKGADFLDGGPGPDRLTSRDKSGDEVDCGSSFDRVKGDGR